MKTLDDTAFVNADQHSGHFKLPSLQEMIGAIHEAAMAKIEAHLGMVTKGHVGQQMRLNGYAGLFPYNEAGDMLAITSPRGGKPLMVSKHA